MTAARGTTAPAAPTAKRAWTGRDVPRHEQFIVGVVTRDPAKLLARYQGIAEAIAEFMGRKVGVVLPHEDQSFLLGKLCDGSIDYWLESAYGAGRALASCQLTPLAIEGKGKTFRYHSVIVVRRDSELRHLTELDGQDIVFEDPGSTSGFVVPALMLQDVGLRLVEWGSEAPPGATRYRFGREELNMVGWVIHGRAAAAAISNQDHKEFANADLKVIARSAAIPRQVVVAGAGMTSTERIEMKAGLFGLSEDAAMRTVLEEAHSSGFAPINEADLEIIQRLQRFSLSRPGS